MFKWFTYLGLQEEVEKARKIFMPFSKLIPKQVMFSLPDGLWTFSLAWFLEITWNDANDQRITDAVFTTTLVISLGLECLQHFNERFGSFSFYDVMWILVSSCCFRIIRRIENDETHQ
jgi:hypothetical protein